MKTVERRRQRGLVALIFVVRPLPAEMQRTEDAVLDSVRTVVAPHAEVHRIQYVDLARRRPAAIMMRIGQHPDSGPNPLPLRPLGAHLTPDIGARLLAARHKPRRSKTLRHP